MYSAPHLSSGSALTYDSTWNQNTKSAQRSFCVGSRPSRAQYRPRCSDVFEELSYISFSVACVHFGKAEVPTSTSSKPAPLLNPSCMVDKTEERSTTSKMRSCCWVVLLVVLCCNVGLIHTARVVPLEAFLNFPNRNQLLSCGNNTVAWVETTAGQSNVVAAKKKSGSDTFSAPFPVTPYRGDDGFVLESLSFSKDCEAVFYTRKPSDMSNPTSAVAPPSSAVFQARLPRDGEPSQPTYLAPEQLCAVGENTTDGTPRVYTVSYVGSFASVNSVEMTGRSTRLFTVRQGTITGLTWSPDRTRLAFANNRGDHGFIGIYTVGQSRIEWLSPRPRHEP